MAELSTTYGLRKYLNAGSGSAILLPSGIIHIDTTQYSSPADTNENDAITWDMPGNTLDYDGAGVYFYAYGSFAANANAKTVRLRVGGTLTSSISVAGNNVKWILKGTIIRTGASAQQLIGEAAYSNTHDVVRFYADTQDNTADITIKVTAQNAAASAGDIVVEGMYLGLL